MISYAQHNEDILLFALLHDVKKGFYVDVGANDPVKDSVTKFFYDRGWNGVNIEPIPTLFKQLAEARPKDVNLNVGIAEKRGDLLLREVGMERHGLSTLTPTKKIPEFLPYKEYPVPVIPLSEALKGVKRIDFMKIDVEGMEHAVLKSYDWKVKPEVLVIEDNDTKDWLPIVTKHGYREVCFDGLNRYYVPNNSRRDLSMYQDILNQEVVPLPQARLREKVEELNSKLQDMYEKHTKLGKEWQAIEKYPERYFSGRVLLGAARKRLLQRFKKAAR